MQATDLNTSHQLSVIYFSDPLTFFSKDMVLH